MELASKIFDRLLQVNDLSSEPQVAELAADIVAFLPPPGEARSAGADLLLQSNSFRMHAKTELGQGSAARSCTWRSVSHKLTLLHH